MGEYLFGCSPPEGEKSFILQCQGPSALCHDFLIQRQNQHGHITQAVGVHPFDCWFNCNGKQIIIWWIDRGIYPSLFRPDTMANEYAAHAVGEEDLLPGAVLAREGEILARIVKHAISCRQHQVLIVSVVHAKTSQLKMIGLIGVEKTHLGLCVHSPFVSDAVVAQKHMPVSLKGKHRPIHLSK